MVMSDEPDVATLALLAVAKLGEGVKTHPVSTLAGAAGAGYILAAGLPDVLVRVGASVALRALARRVVGSALERNESSTTTTTPSATRPDVDVTVGGEPSTGDGRDLEDETAASG
jgi:hypothetical protein